MPRPPRKPAVLDALRAQIRADLAALTESQERASEGVTHEESRQENDKDTRAIEASYLALGLARRVVELRSVEGALKQTCFDRVFSDEDPVALGALVSLSATHDEDDVMTCLLAARGGGLQAEVDGISVRVVTPESPLGNALIGASLDDEVELQTPKGRRDWVVVSVA